MRTNPNAETPSSPLDKTRATARHHVERTRTSSGALGRSIVAAGDLYGRPLADVLTRQHEDLAEHAAEAVYHLELLDREQSAELDNLRTRLAEAHAFSKRATRAYLLLVEELETRAARRHAARPEILRRAHNVYMGRDPEWVETEGEPF